MSDGGPKGRDGGRRDGKRHRGRGPTAVGAMLPRLTKPLLRRRNPAEAALRLDWPAIVGPEIARRCRPLRLAFSDPASRRDATLTLQVEPAFALDLQHLEPQLLERVNGHFGFRLVAALRLRQAPLERPAKALQTMPRGLHRRALAPADEQALAQQVEAIDDERLRGALQRLGRAVRRDRRQG